jgi:spermidine synthase
MPIPPLSGAWHLDQFGPDDVQGHRIGRTIVSTRTKYQQVEILENEALGRFLVLDGKLQSAELDEALYHELLVHPAMLSHPAPKQVLIIGGGEGATLREVLRLPGWHRGAFDDPRAELCHMDGRQYLEQTDRVFDVVVSDLTDILADGLSAALYTEECYRLVARRLAPRGALALQALALRAEPEYRLHAALARTLRAIFSSVWSYAEFIPSFDSLWGFLLALRAQARLPRPAAMEERLRARGLTDLTALDATALTRCFALPKRARAIIEAPGPTLRDGGRLPD